MRERSAAVLPTSPVASCGRSDGRVPVDIPVEVRSLHQAEIGSIVNVGPDGMLVRCALILPPGTELTVRFNLPDAHSITTATRVAYSDATSNMGLEFVHLSQTAQQVLAQFTASLMKYMRRGGRIARRYHLLLHEVGAESQQEIAETVVLSQHGGLLVCRASFTTEHVRIWWPEKKRGAQARIVFRRPTGPGGLVALGFEFTDAVDFWQMDFPQDAAQSWQHE